VAGELVDEAAASDDVTSAEAGRAFIADRIAAFGDLLTAEQAEWLGDEAARLIDGWER
jgi:hypothetical protein